MLVPTEMINIIFNISNTLQSNVLNCYIHIRNVLI